MNEIEIDGQERFVVPCVRISDSYEQDVIVVGISSLRKFITDLEQIAKGYGV